MKKKNNLLAFVIIVVLIGVVFVSIVSKGFTNMDASTWFGKNPDDNPETKEEVLAIDEKGNKLSASGNYSMPERMTFLSTRASTAEDGILITAKFTPENATLTDLKWTVDWINDKDMTHEWLWWIQDTGFLAEELIQLTTTAKTCRVKCLRAFGCPIILKCESVSNPSAYATCRLDYAMRVTNFTPKFADENDNLISYSNDVLNWSFHKQSWLGFYDAYSSQEEEIADKDTWYTYDTGTVKDTYSMEYTVTLNGDIYSDCMVEFNPNGTGVMTKTFKGDVSLDFDTNFIKNIFGFGPTDGTSMEEFMSITMEHLFSSSQSDLVFDLTITLKGAYSTFEKTFTVNRSSWNYGVLIESIELTKPNLTF